MFVILRLVIRLKLGEGKNNTTNTEKLVLYGEMPVSARDTCSYYSCMLLVHVHVPRVSHSMLLYPTNISCPPYMYARYTYRPG